MKATYKKLNTSEQFKMIRIKDSLDSEFCTEHRHDIYELIFIISGSGKHSIDFEEYELKKDLIYLIKPLQVHKWNLSEFKNECDGFIFLFSKELFAHDSIINNLFETNIEACINICNYTKRNLLYLLEMIKEEYENKDLLLVSHLFGAFLKYIIKSKKRIANSSNIDKRVDSLKYLIEAHYVEEKSANFYAKKLDLTTKRLNEIMKENINSTVTELITNKVLIEAKRELIFTSLSIKEISDKLGFVDASYFSRFFKKNIQLAPLDFRDGSKRLVS